MNERGECFGVREVSPEPHATALGGWGSQKIDLEPFTRHLHRHAGLLVDAVFSKKAPVLPIIGSSGIVDLQGQFSLVGGISHHGSPPSVLRHLLPGRVGPIFIHVDCRVMAGPEPPHLQAPSISLRGQVTS